MPVSVDLTTSSYPKPSLVYEVMSTPVWRHPRSHIPHTPRAFIMLDTSLMDGLCMKTQAVKKAVSFPLKAARV